MTKYHTNNMCLGQKRWPSYWPFYRGDMYNAGIKNIVTFRIQWHMEIEWRPISETESKVLPSSDIYISAIDCLDCDGKIVLRSRNYCVTSRYDHHERKLIKWRNHVWHSRLLDVLLEARRLCFRNWMKTTSTDTADFLLWYKTS